MLANQDALVTQARAQAEAEAMKIIQAQKDTAAQIEQEARDAIEFEKAHALCLHSEAKAATQAENLALHEQIAKLAKENDALKTPAFPVTLGSTTPTTSTFTTSSVDAILTNLRPYNELTKNLTNPTLSMPLLPTPVTTVPILSTGLGPSSPAKRPHTDGNEFQLNGQKKVTEPFTRANFEGLIMQNTIS